MISDAEAARMVPWYARPGSWALTAALGILFLAVDAFAPGYWFSVLIGLAVGLSAVVLTKWYTRQYADVCVEKLVKRPMTHRTWSERVVVSIYYFAPAVPLLFIWAVTELRKVPLDPALGVLIIMQILLYPEQQKIYDAAKAELIEMYSGGSED